jgi:hypothetical protein
VWFTNESRGQETIELRIDVHGLRKCHHLDLDAKAESCGQLRLDEGMFVFATTPPNGWTGLEPHFLAPTF